MKDTIDVGTNLTTVAEYAKTALALASFKERFKGVIVEVDTPKGMKEAKKDVAELRGMRTTLEAARKDKKAYYLEGGRVVDAEAKRITAEIVALEEPIKAQVDAKEAEVENAKLAKLEAERQRIEGLRSEIQAFRDAPAKMVGKPSVGIAHAMEKLKGVQVQEDHFEEMTQEAQDAHAAAVSRLQDLFNAQVETEAEQLRIANERAELEQMRVENARLQKEADDRHRAEAERLDNERIEAERIANRNRDEAIRLEREAEQKRLDAWQKDQEEHARIQQEESDRRRKELDAQEAANKVERDRLEAERVRGLNLRTCVQAVIDWADDNALTGDQPFADLKSALANEGEVA